MICLVSDGFKGEVEKKFNRLNTFSLVALC
jgi:hypothetical protein